MRPIAIVAKAFTGCRTKIHALYEQIYGKDCVDIYCKEGCHNDHEIEGLSLFTYSHFGTKILESINAHEIIHVFCDCCDFFFDLMKLNRPFILQRHDIISRRGSRDESEKAMHQSPMTVSVFISQNHQGYIHDLAGIKRSYILYNYPVLAWQPEMPQQEAVKEDTLAYFGSVKNPGNRPFSYRCYLPQFLSLVSSGIKVHIHATGGVHPKLVEVYGNHRNITLHHRVPHSELYAAMSKYKVGFVGYNDIDDELGVAELYAKTCVPNKAFDYMFAGIPTLGYNLGEAEKFVKQWGMCTKDMSDLRACYDRAVAMSIDFEGFRQKYNMEAQKELLFKLAERVRVKR